MMLLLLILLLLLIEWHGHVGAPRFLKISWYRLGVHALDYKKENAKLLRRLMQIINSKYIPFSFVTPRRHNQTIELTNVLAFPPIADSACDYDIGFADAAVDVVVVVEGVA
jgi:hypothetical protein